MKLTTTLWRTLLLILLLAPIAAHAEGVITITTPRAIGTLHSIDIQGSGPIRIEGFEDGDMNLAGDEGYVQFRLASQTIRIYGDVTVLRCSNLTPTSLDVSQCPTLVELDCKNSNLTTLDVSQNAAL